MPRRNAILPLGLLVSLLTGCGSEPSPERLLAVSDLATPAGADSGEPQLATGPQGEVVLSWLEPSEQGYALQHSSLRPGAQMWSEPVTVASGADWYVNPMDMPSVQPITADVWGAHWLVEAKTSPFGYDIWLATSTDGGRSFGAARRLHDDGTDAEHGFVTLFGWGDGLGAVWLDGRELARFHQTEPTAPELEITPVGTHLRYARLDAEGAIVEQGAIDRLVCDCCQTDVAVTTNGPLVVYRDRTEGEIRDIALRRHDGTAWSDPVRVGQDNWQIEGCPVNGPAIAARDSTVVVAWFTAAADRPRVRLARSTDGGTNFASPIDVDTDGAFGQVDVVLANDDSAWVSWWRRNPSGGTQLAVRRVDAEGALGTVQAVAASMASRPLDVPQMVTSGERLVFAWTEFGAESRVRTLLADR